MKGSLTDELYGETLQLSDINLNQVSAANSNQLCDSHESDGDDLWYDDESPQHNSNEELQKGFDLDREWQRRHDQFHTIGYRDGVTAGKEASAQEGFNIGFKESVLAGYNWGLVRGVTSVMACLPDGLKEKLVETPEKREQFRSFYESVHSLSTTDALKLFHDEIQEKKSLELAVGADPNSPTADIHDQISDGSILRNHYEDLQSHLLESPKIKVHLERNN